MRIISLFFIFVSLIVTTPVYSQGNDSPKNKCNAYLADEASLSQYENSCLRIIELAIKQKLISSEELSDFLSSISSGEPINPLAGKTLSAGGLPLKNAFDKIVDKLSAPSNIFKNKLAVIAGHTSTQDQVVKNTQAKTRQIFAPAVIKNIKLPKFDADYLRTIITHDHRELLVLAMRNGRVILYDLNQLDVPPIKFTIGKDLLHAPELVRKPDGKEHLIAFTSSGYMHQIPLDRLPNSIGIKIKISVAPLAWATFFTLSNGKQMFALTDNFGSLFLLDINKPAMLEPHSGKFQYSGKPLFIQTADGGELLAIGSEDAITTIIDMKRPKLKESNVRTGSLYDSAPVYFIDKLKNEYVVFGSDDGSLSVINLKTRKSKLLKTDRKPIDQEPFRASPAHILTPGGHDYIVAGSSDANIYFFDLNAKGNKFSIPTDEQVNNAPLYVEADEVNKLLIFNSIAGSFYFFNLNDLKNPFHLEIGSDVFAQPISVITSKGDHLLVVATADGFLKIIKILSIIEQREMPL